MAGTKQGKSMRASYIVHGIVQGVGYRSLVKKVATSLGLNGFVRNLQDGSVEVFVVGDADSIRAMLDRIDVNEVYGPQVHFIEKTSSDYEDAGGFVVKETGYGD